MVCSLRRLLLTALFPGALLAQSADVSVVGGGGVAGGEDQDTQGVLAVGASVGLPHATRHRFQFDYLFNHVQNGFEDRHFVTLSYVVQGTAGRTRPFFQIGAGVVFRTVGSFLVGSPPSQRLIDPPNENSFAVLFGGGTTIDMSQRFFIRPEVRLYGHVGPTLSVLPAIGVGWRF